MVRVGLLLFCYLDRDILHWRHQSSRIVLWDISLTDLFLFTNYRNLCFATSVTLKIRSKRFRFNSNFPPFFNFDHKQLLACTKSPRSSKYTTKFLNLIDFKYKEFLRSILCSKEVAKLYKKLRVLFAFATR